MCFVCVFCLPVLCVWFNLGGQAAGESRGVEGEGEEAREEPKLGGELPPE